MIVYKIYLNIKRLFYNSVCQDVFASAHDLISDLMKKVSRNFDLRKIFIFESSVRSQTRQSVSTSFWIMRSDRGHQTELLLPPVFCFLLA